MPGCNMSPFESNVLMKKVAQLNCNVGELSDKATEIRTRPYKLQRWLLALKTGKGTNSFLFIWIHRTASR